MSPGGVHRSCGRRKEDTLVTQGQDIDAQLRELLPRLRRFARWLTRDASRGDDLVQSTLERALLHWDNQRRHTALRAWLFSIAYRRFLDNRRRARRYAAVLELLGHRGPAEPSCPERQIIARSVVQALDRLPDEQRLLLLWVSVEGLSYREVAELLNVPLGTVMSRLSRARAALRQISDGDVREGPTLRLLKQTS